MKNKELTTITDEDNEQIDSRMENAPKNKKNYQPIFWKYFWVGFVINIFASGLDGMEERVADEYRYLWLLFLVVISIYIFAFSKIINEAMLSIGKKHWWLLGFLVLVPLGFWVAFFIIRAKLKPAGMWLSKDKSFKLTRKK